MSLMRHTEPRKVPSSSCKRAGIQQDPHPRSVAAHEAALELVAQSLPPPLQVLGRLDFALGVEHVEQRHLRHAIKRVAEDVGQLGVGERRSALAVEDPDTLARRLDDLLEASLASFR